MEPYPYFICSGGQDHYDAWANKITDPWVRFKHAVSMALAERNLPSVSWIESPSGNSYFAILRIPDSSPTAREEYRWLRQNHEEFYRTVDKATELACQLIPEVEPWAGSFYFVRRPKEDG